MSPAAGTVPSPAAAALWARRAAALAIAGRTSAFGRHAWRFQVVTMDEGVGEIGFFASAAGNFKMKNNAMVDKFGRFDKEIDGAGTEGVEVENTEPQVTSTSAGHWLYVG